MLDVSGVTDCRNYHQIHRKHQRKSLFHEALHVAYCLSGYATLDGDISLFVL